MFKILLFVALLLFTASAEVYLLMPMGSNDRAIEANRGRANANRLFDSQNNNRGGYNIGNIYYYAGSVVNIQWTAANGCANPTVNCNFVLQYMCDDKIRDGTTTQTIPESSVNVADSEHDDNPKYGRQESWTSYRECRVRERNRGLFTANQNVQGRTAQYTRQNANGQRFGYECPEEKDYYPYWNPTLWRDIAVLTNQPKLCDAYKAQSQNKASRWSCWMDPALITYFLTSSTSPYRDFKNNPIIPLNQASCESRCAQLNSPSNGTVTVCGKWVETQPWNQEIDCRETEFQRENHLGNVVGGFPASYNWTVPDNIISERCVLRMRYNVSYSEIVGNADPTSLTPGTTAKDNHNSTGTPNPATTPALLDVYSKFGLVKNDMSADFGGGGTTRGYVYKNNPQVDIFGSMLTGSGKTVKLTLGITTDDLGRTFQDRSHRFAIRSTPDDLKGKTIHNVQVSGKRGNIVQVFPGTEYNFSPARVHVKNGDFVHFQWTGSNTNPDNNAGQGKAGTDRSNVVLLRGYLYDELQKETSPKTYGALGRSFPDRVDNTTFLGFSVADRERLATTGTGINGGQFGGNMDELNDAGTYFDLGPRQATQNGIYHYLCTRNNNFSNRDQKGTVIVADNAVVTVSIGWNGGKAVAATGDSVTASQNTLQTLTDITISSYPSDTPSSLSGSASSNYLVVTPLVLPLTEGSTVQVSLNYNNEHLSSATMYRADDFYGEFESISASTSGGVATANVNRGGVFVVKTQKNWGAIAGIIIGCVFGVGLFGFLIWYYKFRKPTSNTNNTNTHQKVNLTAKV